jgi:hypothetical protein
MVSATRETVPALLRAARLSGCLANYLQKQYIISVSRQNTKVDGGPLARYPCIRFQREN